MYYIDFIVLVTEYVQNIQNPGYVVSTDGFKMFDIWYTAIMTFSFTALV